jgi:hypothetical protein
LIDINDRKFTAAANTENGEVSAATVFHYFQDGDVVWAGYTGGEILTGHLARHPDRGQARLPVSSC